MTETITRPATSVHPADILMMIIVAFLTPMFLGVAAGNVDLARTAAVETVNAYRARNHADLIAIAQIIACGLAALGSLSLSMADDISTSLALRLRGNAVALNRAAEQNRRALRESPPQREPADPQFETDVIANVATAKQAAADAQRRLQITPPAPVPLATNPNEEQLQAMWAAAMADVAAEFTADLENLSPEERLTASRRAAALSDCANDLVSGNNPPAHRTADFNAIMRRDPAQPPAPA